MPEERLETLIRENERMRTALRSIQGYCCRAVFGAWRGLVFDIAKEGLRKDA